MYVERPRIAKIPMVEVESTGEPCHMKTPDQWIEWLVWCEMDRRERRKNRNTTIFWTVIIGLAISAGFGLSVLVL